MWFAKKNRRQPTPSQATSVLARLWSALASLNRTRLLWIAGSMFALIAVQWLVAAMFDRPVRHVEVLGQFHRVTALQVEQAVMAYGRRQAEESGDDSQGFVSLDLAELKSVVESIPWVDRARIERHWPNGVRVAITEQIPGARWGERGLLNSRGELFLRDARYLPPELPQLDGPEGSEQEVARLYLDTYPRLAGVGLRLARVRLDARGAWELVVTSTQNTNANSGGVAVRLGRQDVLVRLDRFIGAASPLVASRPGEMLYVDMRYSNGFAVGWADSSLARQRSAPANEQSRGAT